MKIKNMFSRALASLKEVCTRVSVPTDNTLSLPWLRMCCYWVITSRAPRIVNEWIVVDEHSVKRIMGTLCAAWPLLFESLSKMGCYLAGGECENAKQN